MLTWSCQFPQPKYDGSINLYHRTQPAQLQAAAQQRNLIKSQTLVSIDYRGSGSMYRGADTLQTDFETRILNWSSFCLESHKMFLIFGHNNPILSLATTFQVLFEFYSRD